MDAPLDLGRRIVEAARLAVMLHLERGEAWEKQRIVSQIPGGAGRRIGRAEPSIDGVDCCGGAAMDGGDFTPPPANLFFAGTLAAGGGPAAKAEVQHADDIAANAEALA